VDGRERDSRFEREAEGDGVAVMDVLGDRVVERAALVGQR